MLHYCLLLLFFLKKIFLMWTIFKVFIEFVPILLLFLYFGFFGREACGILAPQPGIEPAPPALEGEVLTTGPPGNPLYFLIFIYLVAPGLCCGSRAP